MQKRTSWLELLSLCLAAAACAGCSSIPSGPGSLSRAPFGKMPDGTPIDVYTLKGSGGVEARIINYGGIVISLKAPDRNGKLADVVLGYDTLAGYLKESPYFGSLIGRYGNRIARGKFTLAGKEYSLPVNDGVNSLHGGLKGFDKVVWKPSILATPEGPTLLLTYVSPDGDQGYPGTLTVKAAYSLTSDNALKLVYTATTDKETVLNLTQHSYFNLAGKGDILAHEVMLPADRYTPVDQTLIPTGDLSGVAGTPFDFRKPVAIGARINEDNEQLKFAKGYDHNWVFNKQPGQLTRMARVYEPISGRVLEVFSTAPGLQFYSGNFLDGKLTGKYGWVYNARNAFCMEPQHFPDSPNHPNFPATVLQPGQLYKNTILYKLSVQK